MQQTKNIRSFPLVLAAIVFTAGLACAEDGDNDVVMTLRLTNGSQITAPVLRKSEERYILDLGAEIVSIPAKQVVDAARADGSNAKTDREKFDIYTTGRLKPAGINRHVDNFGDAVLTVSTASGVGSGFLISNRGHFITNYHVVEEELDVKVTAFQRTASGYEKKTLGNVKILAVNPHRDLALLKIDSQEMIDLELPHVTIAKEEVSVGESVFAIGNPLGLERSVTQGIVSSVTRTMGHLRFVQTDASINPGNSGGPLFNLRGEVIGVACAGYSSFDGLAFGIPVSDLVDFLKHRDAYLFDSTQPQNGVKYLAPPSLSDSKK